MCESHTQKELLGLQVSAEAAAQPHNFARELPLPRDFDGTRKEHWKNFSFELRAYLNVLEPDFVNYMSRAADSAAPVTDQRYVLEQDGARVPDERGIRMSWQLKYFLIILCSGPPLTIIQSSETEDGFEIWRLLCRRYSTDPVVSQQGALGKCLNHHFLELASKMDLLT